MLNICYEVFEDLCLEIYNMAIDDFVEAIDEEDINEYLVDDMKRIEELAEKVKMSRE